MKLQRVVSSEKGTFGTLVIDNLPFCVTMELPDKGNQPQISCIPAGTYRWRKWKSQNVSKASDYRVIWIQDVPNRTWIYLHVANWPSEVLGCIGVGYCFGKSPNGEYGVSQSKEAMKGLLAKLPDWGTIEIKNP